MNKLKVYCLLFIGLTALAFGGQNLDEKLPPSPSTNPFLFAVWIDILTGLLTPAPGDTLFYGEPVRVVFLMKNNTQTPLPIRTKDLDWRNFLDVILRRWADGKWVNELFSLMLIKESLSASPNLPTPQNVKLAKYVILQPKQSLIAVFELRGNKSKFLEVGKYKVEVTFRAKEIPFGEREPRGLMNFRCEKIFKVKKAKTLEERVEMLCALATRARLDGDIELAFKYFKQIIKMIPNSWVGYAGIGKLQIIKGEYADAIKSLRKAMEIVRGGKDRFIPHKHNRIFIEHLLAGMKAEIERCERLMKEKP